MKKFKGTKKLIALLLSLSLITGMMPATAWNAFAAEGDSTVVIAASDYQRSNSNTIMTSIMNQIKEDYNTAYGALLGGDYDAGNVSTTATHIKAVDDVISSVFPNITDDNRIYIQGNHENYAGLKVDGTNLMKESGEHDTEYYGVYAINHDDFPWETSTNPRPSSTLVQETANDLGVYLDDKIKANYKKPIFVMSHLPLHATTRGDNQYAKLIFDKLEAAGEAGLNIIFLCGHNHSGGYDQYLGNGSFYLPKGSSLTVVDGTSNTYTDEDISFTYMNYGYLGNISGSACTHQTMTAFEITDNEVVVKRYDTDGIHELKAAGVNVSGYNTNTKVYGTAVIDLSTGNSETTDLDGGNDNEDPDDGIIDPGTGNYTYELVTEIKAGEKYVIVGNDHAVALMDNNGSFGNQTVTISGTTLTSDTALTEWTISGTDNGTIISDDNHQLGYDNSAWGLVTGGTVEFDITASNGKFMLQMQRGYNNYNFYYDGTGWTDKSTSDHYVRLYKLTGAGSGSTGGGTVTPEGGDWITITSGVGGTIYTLDTDGVSTGEDYLIVSTNTDGTAQALRNNNGSVASAEVTISNGQIVTSETDIVWKYDSSKYLSNGSHYFYLSYNNASNFLSTSEKRALSITSNSAGEGAYTVKRDGNSYNYYLNYNNGSWTNGSSADDVYFYVKSGTEAAGTAEYAKLDGELTYTVSRGATADKALDAVMRGINVLTSANADGNNPTTLEDSNSDIRWELASNYDGAVAGEYAVKIYYKDKQLGTAKVIVPEVTINGITVNPASGVVNEGASNAALVGATITVDVDDNEGEDYTVPVTIGMLSGDFNTKTAGIYEGLTVSYNGFKYEGFTLTVKEKVVNNYPSYPNEGAVKVNKTATGVDFQKTGVAKVELSASGVPMNQGVDVVIILDTSSSMTRSITVDGESVKRIDLLRPAVDNLIQQLQTKHEDGSDPDIDIAIASFNGNTLSSESNYISDSNSKPQTSGTSTDSCGVLTGQKTVANGWVDIMNLDEDWGTQNSGGNIPTGSGTNYDYGLELAYNLLAQKKIDNGDDSRKQFVLFLSDGAASQYNGVWSNDGEAEFANWLLGNYDETDADDSNDIPDTVSDANQAFYTGYTAGKGQLHRAAEAIKGAPDDEFGIVSYDKDANGELKTVSGLGATVYSIGLLLQDVSGGSRTAEQQEIVLETIASSSDLFTSIKSVDGLGKTFSEFGEDVLYAAENAVFEDALGENYNIQLANTTKRLVDGKEFELKPAPTMEVREYTIWTRAELEDANGNLSEENAKKVGTRKTDASGDYIYNTLEVVSFSDDGKKAYTGDDKENSIMKDDVICAKTFWYNNSTASVMIDADGDSATGTDGKEFELKPETFLWKVGTIKSKEIALSYYVYLDDSLEGEASAGSYDTNEYAILSYDNYLGNSCKKETVSPQMAWLSANVSYAYYLVNREGKPVNANGEEVTFANREVVVHPTKYGEIKLNTIEDVANLPIAASGILDEGKYALFDYDAEYNLIVNSDATGGWEITVGNKKDENGNETLEKLPATTYVTGFSDTLPFTNETSVDSNNYDYTHTTVWFAVVWEPKAIEDTVVVDYGLPVDVHVMENDLFGDFGTLEGVTNGVISDDGDISSNDVQTTDSEGTFGSVEVIKPDTGANAHNSVIRYTLDKDNSMQMNGKDVFTYSVDYTNTKLHTNNGYYYGQLTVIPATTIYYEDDFVTYSSLKWDDKNNNWATGTAKLWSKVNDDTYNENEVITQDEDRPGDINYAFDKVIDANNVYGYDSAYKECSEYSLGSAMKATVDYDNAAQAQFTFWGTGFDVISMTSNTTGTILVKIYDADTKAPVTYEVPKTDANGNKITDEDGNVVMVEKTYSFIVDTYYGYKQVAGDADKDGTIEEGEVIWEVDPEAKDALYQIPVMKVENLPYGHYSAVIQAVYEPQFDHVEPGIENGTYDFYLDAIRIYDPANNGAADQTIEDAYKADNEGWPVYTEVRDSVLEAGRFDAANSDTVNGVVFIDGVKENADIADYEEYGPNNEVYLASGQAIAFELDGITENVADVQIGLKSVGENATVKVYNAADTSLAKAKEMALTTATDMYYSIADLKDGIVVISNTGTDGVVSVTNVKVTYKENPNVSMPTDSGVKFKMSKAALQTTLASFESIPAEEPETPVTPEEPDTPITPEDPETPVVPENPVEPEEPETPPVVEEPEEPVAAPAKIISLKTDKQNYVQGDKVKVTVTTNKEATKVKVGTKVLKNYTTKNGNRTWTTTVNATKLGKLTIGAIAYNSKGTATKKVTKVVTVKKFAPRIFNVTLNKYKVKKGQKYTVTVKAGSSVKHVRVNGKKITKFTTKNGVKTFKVTFKANKVGKQKVKVIAYNKALYPTNPKVKTITVTRK